MGCDIHCYIEYKGPYDDRDNRWSPFGGRINPGRNYYMFERMAGVRGDPLNALVPPRGLPEKLAYNSSDDYWLYVSDTADKSFVEGVATRLDAERWVNTGWAMYRDTEKKYVSHPDWHSPSWLTCAEFERVITDIDPTHADEQYWAMLAAMKQLNHARVVFWFDN